MFLARATLTYNILYDYLINIFRRYTNIHYVTFYSPSGHQEVGVLHGD